MLRQIVDIDAFHKVLLVHNYSAGKQTFFSGIHKNVDKMAKQLLQLYGPDRFEYVQVSTFAATQEVGRRICEEKVEWVIVAGGDGTLRALVEVCVDADYWPYVSIYPAAAHRREQLDVPGFQGLYHPGLPGPGQRQDFPDRGRDWGGLPGGG